MKEPRDIPVAYRLLEDFRHGINIDPLLRLRFQTILTGNSLTVMDRHTAMPFMVFLVDRMGGIKLTRNIVIAEDSAIIPISTLIVKTFKDHDNYLTISPNPEHMTFDTGTIKPVIGEDALAHIMKSLQAAYAADDLNDGSGKSSFIIH